MLDTAADISKSFTKQDFVLLWLNNIDHNLVCENVNNLFGHTNLILCTIPYSTDDSSNDNVYKFHKTISHLGKSYNFISVFDFNLHLRRVDYSTSFNNVCNAKKHLFAKLLKNYYFSLQLSPQNFLFRQQILEKI